MKTHTVLVIDDNEYILSLVERILADTDFPVLTSTNCREGFELAKKKQPDVLLLDIMMPDIDGLAMSGFMRKNRLTAHIPIVFLTGKRTQDTSRFIENSGAADYITKPFSPADLVERLRKAVSK
jgi:DNA-binding response OmpR family regulator